MDNKLPIYEPSGFALQIFKDRYAIHENESYQEACSRVSRYIADAESGLKREEYFNRFLEILSKNRFSCGGRVWRNSGRPRGQLLNCFVIPVSDSRESWAKAIGDLVVVSGMGGGVGYNCSKVRPRGTPIKGTGGTATGAVSLMKCINAVGNEIKEGGGRRTAIMLCLDFDHPDIVEFLEAKLDNNELNNANISVCIDNEFLDLYGKDKDIILKWAGEEKGRIKAKWLWNKVIENAWKNGDPGFLNKGYANEMNPMAYYGDLEATNPCGEIYLFPYDACCLGSINLHTHVIDNQVDWDLLEETVSLGVRFLDNVLDKNNYPLKEIEQTCQSLRRIGLGVMGLCDTFLELGMEYGSEESLKLTDKIMDFIKKRAYDTSITLAVEKGSFQEFNAKKHTETGFIKKKLTPSHRRRILEHGLRNCAILMIAPCGTTSIVAGVSSGVEPMFAPIYRRNFNKHNDDQKKKESSSEIVIHPLLEKFIKEERCIKHFKGAHEISPETHIKIQSICQKHLDNSISKTINLPNDFPVENLSDIISKYIKELKGITIFRDGSKGGISPLMPLPIEEAQKYINKTNTKTEATTIDCPNGKCEI